MGETANTDTLDLVQHELHAVQPVFRVPDVVQTAHWYRDVLGFTIDFLWSSPGGPVEHARVIAVDHASRVGIQLTAGLGEGVDPHSTGWTMIHVGRNIETLYDSYRKRGVRVVRQLGERPWGMKDFDVADCNGHILRFAAES